MMLRVLALVVVLAAVIAGGLALADDASAAPQKKLFSGRWYQQVENDDYDEWMTLVTSKITFACGSSEASCTLKWSSPVLFAMADWNSRRTTVDFDRQKDFNLLYDVNIFVNPLVVGDPSLLGLALTLDQNSTPCNYDCTIYFAQVYASDLAHVGDYSSSRVRRATVAHELGHILALRHESVNGNESVHYPCGVDDTGPIPASIMSYGCIEPASLGGAGIFEVQPWDVCGVNIAYFDPKIKYEGCEDIPVITPSPSPTPEQRPTASDFAWFLNLEPGNAESECDIRYPVPPNDPLTAGLCVEFDLEILDGTYTTREVLTRNGEVVRDLTQVQPLTTDRMRISFAPPGLPGNYHLELYANGALLGQADIVVGQNVARQGDANCNGAVEVGDIGALLKMSIGQPGPQGCEGRGDVNCQNGTDARDALAVAIYLSGAEPLPVSGNCTPIGQPVPG